MLIRRLIAWTINLRIATKVASCFGVLIAIGLCGVAVTFPNLWRIDTVDNRTVASFRVLDATKTMWIGVLKQESDVRGYLLTRDPGFLERAKNGDKDVDAAFDVLRDLILASAPQRTRVARLAKLIKTWRAQVLADTASEAKAGGTPTSVGAEGALNRILRTLTEINTEENRDLAIHKVARTQALTSAYRTNALMPLVALLASAALGWCIHLLFSRPIARLTDVMRRLAGGETSIEIPFTQWKEEIGAMSRALEIFQKAILDANRLRAEQQETRERIAGDRASLLRSMADRFEDVVGRIVEDVSSSATQMQTSAESLLGLAQWTTTEVKTVAGVTKRASSTMHDVASETERLSRSVGDINERMAYSTSVARQAVDEADRTTASIRDLERLAGEVDSIVSLIKGIAQQTNLLALNATIEAARAGEAGRGFSVVAGEVKSLADATAAATVQIRKQIEDIRAASLGVGGAIGQISQTVVEMALVTRDVTNALENQGAATREMMQETQATARLTADVSSQLDMVSEGAVTTGCAATGLLSSAKNLAGQAAVLNDEARRFVASVRTGQALTFLQHGEG